MFCNNCGKRIPDNVGFCPHCGAAVNGAGRAASPRPGAPRPGSPYPPQQAGYPQPGRSGNSKRMVAGIVLLVLAAMAILGGFANGFYASFAYSVTLSKIITVFLEVGMAICGIVLIVLKDQ